jgi:peptidoglycan/LPS O-acetylase OafA/YrhL
MIPGLDGLRAVAFFLVFLFHNNYLNIGWVGVQLFFVLSGFLITGILIDMKGRLPIRQFFAKFYGRRFLRIFPLYYFYLFLMALVAFGFITVGYRINRMNEYFSQMPYALAYVYNFFCASSLFKDSYFITHFWSLSIEEQFYLFWPLLIWLTPQNSYKKLFIATIILGPLLRFGISYTYNLHIFPFLNPQPAFGVYTLPFSHIDAFGMGALASQFRIPKARQQFFILLAALPIIGFATQYLATGDLGYLSGFGFPFPLANGLKQVWGYSLLNYLFALAIYSVAREGLFTRFLELGWMKYLGKISYGLYVYHYALIYFANRMQDFLPLTYTQTQGIAAVISFFATLLVASLSYKYIEKPVLDLKNRFFAVEKA